MDAQQQEDGEVSRSRVTHWMRSSSAILLRAASHQKPIADAPPSEPLSLQSHDINGPSLKSNTRIARATSGLSRAIHGKQYGSAQMETASAAAFDLAFDRAYALTRIGRVLDGSIAVRQLCQSSARALSGPLCRSRSRSRIQQRIFCASSRLGLLGLSHAKLYFI